MSLPSMRKFFLSKTSKAWFIFLLAVSFYFLSCLQRVAPAVIADDFMRSFTVGAGAYGLISAAYFYIYAGIQIPVGLIFDRFGIAKPMLVSSLFLALGTLIFSLAPNYSIAFLGRSAVGAGAGFAWIGVLKLLSLWFPKNKYAFLTGFGQTAGFIGAIAGQAPLAYFNQIYHWQNVMMVFAVINFIIFGLMFAAVWAEKALASSFLEPQRNKILPSIKTALFNSKIWYPIIFGAFTATGLWAFGGLWGASFLEKCKGLTRAEAALASSCVFIGAMIGGSVLGFLSDKYQNRKIIMIICNILSFIFLMMIIFMNLTSLYWTYFLVILTGIFLGGSFFCFVVVKEVSPSEYTGVSLGIANTILMGVSSLVQPIAGAVLDFFWQGELELGLRIYDQKAWTYAILIFPFCQVIAFLGALNVKEQ